MELQPAISIQGWMIINLLLKRRISAQRWARWYSRSSELCPAPVWWITGVWAAAYVLQTFCDCMRLGRCITDTYPYHSLKFVYAFIGELVSKPDSLSCFLLLLEKRYEGQSKALVCCAWLEPSSQPQTELQSCSNCILIPEKPLHGGVCLDQYSMLPLRKRRAGLGVLHLLFLASRQCVSSCSTVCWKA